MLHMSTRRSPAAKTALDYSTLVILPDVAQLLATARTVVAQPQIAGSWEAVDMSIRKRTWMNGKGEEKTAWVVDYADGKGVRRLKTFAKRRMPSAFPPPRQSKFETGFISPTARVRPSRLRAISGLPLPRPRASSVAPSSNIGNTSISTSCRRSVRHCYPS